MTKTEYIKKAKSSLNGKALELALNQIELFFDDFEVEKKKYSVGDDVILEKNTLLHGVFGELDAFDYTLENGFVSVDFTDSRRVNKISHSVGMWVIKERIPLADYVRLYSGFTVTYTIGRGPGSVECSELIPYHKFDEFTEKLNDRPDVWMYWGDQTKEIRFLPSLVSNKKQLAFILSTKSEKAKKMLEADTWNTSLDEETLKQLTDYRYYEKFLKERFNRNAQTTDRENAIIFGIPARLIEGIFVGRKLEEDKEKLNYIKSKLPACYICNIDGKVVL